MDIVGDGMMAKRCYYETLSVERTASDGDIKTAFRRQASAGIALSTMM